MEEKLQVFAGQVESKGHMFQLVKKLHIILALQTEKGEYRIGFHNNKVDFNIAPVDETSLFTICGQEEAFCSVLEGRLKLRDAVAGQKLKTTCPFRILLTLESLIYLARPPIHNG
ncbi:hypothetical protein [Bacillus sp. T33-2]|uniref:hypothetical protein n=1 Tax=Bacillus sp. T33-2 TaxID=2054168 RepID=UPI000C788E25|nr:hypothetical protein [Bacillus sp. T33-2]PLR92598.1 hypothetical protein CVD19_20295 [Bacillus sp. T33-2]